MADTGRSTGNPKSPKKRWTQVLTWLVIVFFVFLVPAFMILLMLDGQNPRWVTCEVIEAESSKGNRFNASDWLIGIETKDCGRVVYSQGINADNVEDIAASFEPGDYDFQFGLASRLAADGWIPLVSPTAHDFREAQ